MLDRSDRSRSCREPALNSVARSRRLAAAGASAVVVSGLALAAAPGFDYLRIPAPHAETEAFLRERGVSLAEAIEIVEAETAGGVVADISFATDATPWDTIIALVYHGDGLATRFHLDGDTGGVIESFDVPRLPGWEVDGDAVVGANGASWWTVEAGDGDAAPAPTSNVRMEYTGYLLDGSVFDSSVEIGRPITVPIGSLLPGWSEGMSDMVAGERRKIIVPPQLAFGSIGSPPKIPADATLVLDVELLKIVDYRTVPETPPGEPVVGEPITTATGLKYWDLEVGAGDPIPVLDALVDVHFVGYLTDGEVFQRTSPEGAVERVPSRILLRRWLTGASEGVIGMRPGGKRKLIIPSQLGYGTSPRGGVPAGATLIIDIELVDMVNR